MYTRISPKEGDRSWTVCNLYSGVLLEGRDFLPQKCEGVIYAVFGDTSPVVPLSGKQSAALGGLRLLPLLSSPVALCWAHIQPAPQSF